MNSNPPFTSRLRISVAVWLALAAGVAFVPDLWAQTSLTWTGTTDGSWGTAANWGGTTPTYGTTTDITFGSSNTNTSPSFLGAARIIRSLNFNDLADGNVIIRLTTTATNTSAANLTFQAASGSANLTIASGADGNFTIGNSTGSVVLSSNLLVDHNGTGTLTIDRPVTSTGGITKNGTGILILSPANSSTFTGGLTLNTGTLVLGQNTALGGSGNVFTINGGTIDVTAARTTTNNNAQNWNGDFTFNGTNTLDLGTGAVAMNANRIVTVNASTLTVGGIISGAGFGLTKAGAGNLTLTGANSFSGNLTISSGTVSGSTSASALGAGAILLGDTAGSNSASLTSSLAGTFTNNITVRSGSSGTLSITGVTNNTTFSGSVALNNNLTLDQASASRNVTLSGAITQDSTARTITKGTGAGAVNISGATTLGSGGLTLANSGAAVFTHSGGITGTGDLTLRNNSTGASGITISNTVNNSGTITNSGSGSGSVLISGGVGANVTGITQNSSSSGVTVSTALSVNSGGTTLTSQNGALTVSGNITGSGNLTLRNDGSTANGITISTNTVNNTGTITNSGSGSGGVLISSAIGSNVTRVVQNSSTSTLTLSGANSYSGGTTVSAGVLSIASTSALPSWNTNGGYSVANGASLAVYNAVTDANIATMLGTTNFAAGSAIGFDTTTAVRTYSVALGNTAQGSLGLTKTDSNTLTLTGANTYTGNTTINAGTLSIGAGGTTGSISSNSVVTINSGTLALNRSDAVTLANRIFLGNGSQTILNSSSSTDHTFSGDISSLAGAASALTLQAQNNSALNFTGNITVNGSVSFANSSPYITLSGNNSASSWILSTSPYYVALASAGALGSSGSISMSGGGLVFTNNSTDVSSRIVVGSGNSYVLGVTNSNSFTINSALTANGTNALNVGGSSMAGTLVLGNSNSSFTGAVTITGGTLSVAGIGNTGSNSYLGTNSSITIGSTNNQGTLLYTGSGEATNKTITIAGAQGATITANNPTGTLRFTSNVTSTFTASKTFTLSGTGMGEIAGSIGNNGSNVTSLTKSGAGTWTLSGNNSYTGNTTVSAGTLVFGNTAAKATGAVTATASGSIGLGVGAASGDFSDANVTTLFNTGNLLVNTSNITLNSASGVAIDTTAGDFTQSSALTAGRALTKLGNNTLTLSGNNTYTGNTTIRVGTLQLAKTASLYNATTANWTASRIIVNSGATLALNVGGTGEFSVANVTTLMTNLSGANGNATQGFAAGSFIALDTTNAHGANFVFAGTIFNSTGIGGGAVGLTKLGSGTLILTGLNTYTGTTTINAGTLQIGNGTDSGSIASTSAVTNNGALVYNVGAGNRTLAAAISGSGSLAQNSSGTLTLTGNNTYTGATSVNAGTLLINGSTHSSSAVTVANGATLGGSGTINGATTISGNLAPGNSGAGVLTFGSSLVLNSQANVSFTLNGTSRGTDYNGIDLVNSNLTYGGNLTINVASAFLNSSPSATFSLFSGFNGTPSGNLASVSLSGAYGAGSFAENGSGVWNLDDSSGNRWSFNQADGNLAFAAIPEPSVYALLLTGLAAMAILNQRRRKARADVASK